MIDKNFLLDKKIITDDELKEVIKTLIKDTQWIKSGLRNGSINISCNHDTYINSLYEANNIEELHAVLCELFQIGLSIRKEKNFKDLKEGNDNISGYYGLCNDCGENVSYSFNGKELTPFKYVGYDKEPLKCIENKKEFTFELNFFANEVICSNSIPYLNEIITKLKLDSINHYPNSVAGVYQRIKNYASINVLTTYIGETTSELFTSNKTLLIGGPFLENDIRKLNKVYLDSNWLKVIDVENYKALLINTYGEEEGLNKFNELDKDLIKTNIVPGNYKSIFYKDGLNLGNKLKLYCKLELNEKAPD